ncbi:protein transport protein SEC31 homolog B isoform X2 [Amborella trichopoda]|uniref:protein transport protein SEC31 homolog B isoform X2 n=1 Tax=Amborella trichopoda TaxID=13333 RepID=UPI0009BF98E3|nr:protein transport protein SEC31 homolog B isoform X2 [Amborella trichopoda]|eukprot:XP_020519257.1 protein transport protein SEC31 homolog B isoform X2 [Amborella trichopoda]
MARELPKMEGIKGAPRSALVAFSPDSPFLAAGTMAGAVDLSFSSSANLEIFKLDFESDKWELPVVGECTSNERFNRLSWGNIGSGTEEYSLGLIAGGLVDGCVNLWNPLSLISSRNNENAVVARLQKHTGPVRGLEFNKISPNLLASGAEEGDICIWDIAKPAEPSLFPSLKGGSGAQGEVSFLSWNPKVQHILASTSYSGTTVIWDLKRQKPVISFSDSIRRRCSVFQWNPEAPTQLIVASDDDRSPSLRVWDMRNTISPTKEFIGHSKGVIAMSWCPIDGAFLLTCAKDNRTICWDTFTGEIVCELPASTNWNFDVHWYPKIPGVISASSFDGKIGIYNIEACSRLISGELTTSGFPVHLRAPKWLKRPVGASFGFGGKLAAFHSSSAAPGATPGTSEVYVHNLITEDSLVRRSTEFETAIQNGERASVRALCEQKSEESQSEDDRETWSFLKVMFDDEGAARTKLLAHLGFTLPSEESKNVHDDLGQAIAESLSFDETTSHRAEMTASHLARESLFSTDNGEDFFDNLESPTADVLTSQSNDGLVVEDVIPNGVQTQDESEGPGAGQDSSVDEVIQRALVVGNYKEAVLQCIAANRMADALVIAHAGGASLWESTRDQYLKKSHSSYLKVVSAMVSNDLLSLVNTRPLNSWKETLALLCTFAQSEDWTVLCDTLASRLMAVGNTLAATLCYICAGNIDRTVEIWSQSLNSQREGRSYMDLLQDLMEKTIVLALATGRRQFSSSLSKLVENYAELLASQGQLTTAMEYLKLLGSEDSSPELTILRDRIALSGSENEGPQSSPYDNMQQQAQPSQTLYGAEHVGYSAVDSSQQYYQPQQPQTHSVPGSPYSEGYQQTFGASYGSSYQPMQPRQQHQDYMTPGQFQPAASPQVFLPSQPQVPQMTTFTPAPVAAQPVVRPFVPSTPPVLPNAEQYQQPSLGSRLYPGSANPMYQVGQPGSVPMGGVPSQPAMVPRPNMPTQSFTPSPSPQGFTPVTTNPGFVPRPNMALVQPPSPTQAAQAQPVAAPQAPPPTVQTVDTSNVAAELRPVIATLTRLYNETSEALGGARANPVKKREIEDNSRKIGALFAKLNTGDISPNAASKLGQLCQALDSGDYASALHIQVLLTTSDWDECNFWLAALKRMIKTRQSVRLG